MIRKKHICKCGWSGRADQIVKHTITCKASPIIESLHETINLLNNKVSTLENENKILKAKLETHNLYQLQPKNVTINNNNIQNNNITFYGNEKIPDSAISYSILSKLCQQNNFEDCVPTYVRLKHFPEKGKGNIRLRESSEGQVLETYNDGRWIKVCKESEIAKIIDENSHELIERFGNKNYTQWYKSWASNVLNTNSNEYKDVKQGVENVIFDNSQVLQ
tara:strand:- start:1461 stop:2120 length:660 start_codon:yes stop_codon:yes gene_type:complete